MPALLVSIGTLLVFALTAFASNCSPACVNGACNAAGTCVCSTGTFLTFTDTKCDNVSTISAGGVVSKLAQSNTTFLQSQQVNFADTVFQGGFPIGEGVIATALFICSNGYVTLDSNYCTSRIDLLRNSVAPSFIAPFATSFDYRSAVGAVSTESSITYELVPSIDAVPRLSQMRANISDLANTTSAIVITWNKMSPPTLEYSKTVQQITMQLIIFTDMRKVTVAAMLYSANTLKHYFNWVPTLIAWKTGGNLVTLASTRSTAMAYANQTVNYNPVKTRIRILPIYLNNSAPVNYAAMCSREATTPLPVTPSSSVANACPQTQQQARSDPRYTKDAATVTGKQPYKLLLTANLENVTQLTCVYHNDSGGLLMQDSSIKVVSKNVTLGVNLFDYCCNRAPALCSLYYNEFPQPSSSGYGAPGSAGFITGAGLFRTFDNYQYKFLAIGDFWLVNNTGLKVQIRMENLNTPSANNTAGVTSVAAQFTGATNFSIEVYRDKSVAQISTAHYSINQGPFTRKNLTGSSAVQTEVLSNVAIISSSSKIICYTSNSNSWIEISTAPNGLTVTVFLNKSPGNVAGLLGNYDANSQNEVAYRNGTALSVAQQANLTLFTEALTSWAVAPAGESLFLNLSTPPTAATNWTPLYWNAAWNTNQTALIEALFSGNETVYNASVAACSAKLSNTTEYRYCILEFVDCKLQASCSEAYLTRLDSLFVQLKDLSCLPPQWNATSTPFNVKEGDIFKMELATVVDGGSSGRTFSKISGPVGLNVYENGSLTWVPAQSEISALIVLRVADVASGCASLWPVPLRMTRRNGLCPANAAESFATPLASGIAITPQNQASMSACECSQNYYGPNCTFATCPLNCFACNTTLATSCSSTCPANYDLSTSGSLTICAYRDRCDNSACTGAAYTGCISADPAIQTEFYKHQCICAAGFQYPLSNLANKTRCEDINECLLPTHCDTSKNRTCNNTAPGFSCPCSDGFEPVDAGCTTGTCSCKDINECSKNSSICSNGNCTNTIGSYRCECSTGFYAETSRKCSDIDECANPATSKCTHDCTNTPGGFNCTCKNGFAHPSSDPVACVAQTNCTSNTCAYKSMCAKVGDADTCYCLPKQTLSGTACNPASYCTAATCGAGGNCTDVGEPSTGYSCVCGEHYEKNSLGTCVKKQYCTDPSKYPGVCPAGGKFECTTNVTTNAPTCACSSGYAKDNSTQICVDINECDRAELNSCDRASAVCFNVIGSYTCDCKFGYKRINTTHCTPAPYVYMVNGTFTDLNFSLDMGNYLSEAFNKTAPMLQKRFEAALPPDGSGTGSGPPTTRVFFLSNGSVVAGIVASYNSPTTPKIIRETSSSTLGLSVTVANVNECANATLNDCSTEHICVDTDSGYKCKCKPDYTRTGIRNGFPSTKEIDDCVDIDECLTQCKISDNKTCVNMPGNFSCSCSVNGTYSPNPKTGPCEDPCVPGRCLNGGVCQYQKSDQFPFKCVCVAGYTGFTCELWDDNYIGKEIKH
uniref:EGF-like domain-containing protein n=1 Tax=Macrostomum lignano TaxID=282301 RepID=A0A1I8HD29_9PLAT